jgi:hypothetical protein
MSETPQASGMSQAQSQVGGDPLELVDAVGTEDDALPGPPDGVEPGDATAEETAAGGYGAADDTDSAAEVAPTPNPPGRTMNVDPDTGKDPLDEADAEGMRPPGVGDSASGSDPMPDMTGTTD